MWVWVGSRAFGRPVGIHSAWRMATVAVDLLPRYMYLLMADFFLSSPHRPGTSSARRLCCRARAAGAAELPIHRQHSPWLRQSLFHPRLPAQKLQFVKTT